MSMEFQVFNPRPVIEVQSASPNHIEAALRDVHTRAPNLQLLIVILPDVSGHYGMLTLEDLYTSKFFEKKESNECYGKTVFTQFCGKKLTNSPVTCVYVVHTWHVICYLSTHRASYLQFFLLKTYS